LCAGGRSLGGRAPGLEPRGRLFVTRPRAA
jgi:hypothetical protein